AAVALERWLDDREAEAGAVRLEREEGLEEARHGIPRHARPRVADAQPGGPVGARDLHAELASGEAVERLRRILDQVDEDLPQALAIPPRLDARLQLQRHLDARRREPRAPPRQRRLHP